MVADQSFHHRPTLKQTNKPFKSRHATKGQMRDKAKGRVQRQSIKGATLRKQSRLDRRNAAKLEQKKKRETLVAITRLFTGRNAVPKIVCIIPLCKDNDVLQFVRQLYRCENLPPPTANDLCGSGPVYLTSERQKQTLQLLMPSRNFINILDTAKVADFCVFLVSAEEEVDRFGELCLRAIQSQGVPSVVSVVQHLNQVPVKKRNDVKKSLASFMSYFFPDQDRVHSVDTDTEAQVVMRSLTGQLPKPIHWRDSHPYLLADEVDFAPNPHNPSVGSLKVTGFARGARFSANRLVHLPNYGNFQLEQILSCPLAAPLGSKPDAANTRHGPDMDAQGEVAVLERPDPEKRESLQSENDPDLLANEQTWPTEEELQAAEERVAKMQRDVDAPETDADSKNKKRVPKGTSAYQAAWIVDSDNDEDDEDGDGSGSDSYEDIDDSDEDDAAIEDEEEAEAHPANEDDNNDEYEEVALEDRSSQAGFQDLDPEEEDRQLNEYLARQRAFQNEVEFPDEIDTPLHMPARTRFQRYRGLQNFRRSFWDPFENLPLDYGRIYRFADYRRTRHRVTSDIHVQGVQPGTRITLVLADVPVEAAQEAAAAIGSYTAHRPWIVFGLMQHENKMSVIHFTVTRDAQYTEPVRSKDALILHCGFRRFRVRPLYSQNTPGGKGTNHVHKYERFLRMDQTSVATVFAPIQFGQMPIALYKETADPNEPTLVATGTFMNAEPNRIIAKRIILSGHPFRVNKKSAVVRYMFFQPEDVLWFKPVQLYTKYGRQGHIKESLGTHGYMKCTFDGPMKQQDTVLMNLYKRIFPKWNTELWRDTSDRATMYWLGVPL
ncbi:hypothetical protein SYNPS1DRAFT_33053 [Syncephalis pseudoplumigaleata]|uniref:Bms1-type G domain-containing protein n=1 Tax=Syncephalis pseudoplumigaleata TaxID=1712513 RepID=A0A4P9Z140_9FUNG|nr:hypothetical protein SYNPS1DRAFT_33053 [Syncephalis pseudoplumigaleata]|eukprot:RKP25100.1 hypothetical protein SYNPS1DRAFT_33053 [Syncephalis pseudoplumigaleata]